MLVWVVYRCLLDDAQMNIYFMHAIVGFVQAYAVIIKGL